MPASERQQREVAARRERVLAKRAAGMTYQQIADDEPALKNAACAVVDAERALKARGRERIREGDPLTLELERLDALERSAQTIMRNAVRDNPALALKAIDRLTRISQRRTALLGLHDTADRGQRRSASGLDEVAAQRSKRRRAQGW